LLAIDELKVGLEQAGLNYTTPDLQSIVDGLDADGSGFISFQELLKLIRRLRDGEFVEIGKVFKRYTDDGNLLHLENMGLALGDLGYCVSEDAIFCILDELGELQHELQMTREELAMFLRVYRRMEGFTPEEVAEIKTAFDEQYHILRERAKLMAIPDEPGSPGSPKTPKTPKGTKTPATPAASQVFENGRWDVPPIDAALDALRSSRVMRAFGFARSMQQVQGMLDLIDLDGSGKLEFNEFLKLMHRLFREEAMRRRKIFTALDTKRNGNVPVLKLTTAIKMLVGAEPSVELAEEAAKSAGLLLTDTKSSVSRSGFEVFFKHYRTLGVQEIRENACYSLAEVQLLRETFIKYDADKSGTVEKRELARIITEYFPEATKSKEAQREVQLAIKDVDVNHDGMLDFREFLALMRRFDDSRDESDINLEKTVVEDLKYGPEEVEGYRQIFLANANLVGELSLEMLTEILCKVVDLSPDEQEELGGLVFKVNPDSRQVVRFPHFLRLVKMITDENYGRVNQSSARILRKATKSNGS
jgi:Ca2+-binding EF-hand superfamily protein